MDNMNIIAVNAKGKTKEEVREELIKRIDEHLDEIIVEQKEKGKKKKESKKLLHELNISCREEEGRDGFNVEIDCEGKEIEHLWQMLVCGTFSALKSMGNGKVDLKTVLGFSQCLLEEFENNIGKKEE